MAQLQRRLILPSEEGADDPLVLEEVHPEDNIVLLKMQIESLTGISSNRHILSIHPDEPIILDDGDRTLQSYGVDLDSTALYLSLRFEEMHPVNEHDGGFHQTQTFVQFVSGEKYAFPYTSSDSVLYVQRCISRQFSIPLDEISLIFCGKSLEGHRTLAAYGIAQNTTLHVVQTQVRSREGDDSQRVVEEKPSNFFVRTSSGVAVAVAPAKLEDATVGEMKSCIEMREGIPARLVHLFCGGKFLRDEERTLRGYGVELGATLLMFLRL